MYNHILVIHQNPCRIAVTFDALGMYVIGVHCFIYRVLHSNQLTLVGGAGYDEEVRKSGDYHRQQRV